MNGAAWGWADYFYPDTYDASMRSGILRNRFGIQDPEEIAAAEYVETMSRRGELRANPDLIDRTYDAYHLKAIHGYLFQDVYEWAGQYRSVDMSKGNSFFYLKEIDKWLQAGCQHIYETDWFILDAKPFADACATVFAAVNKAHPFREGNGRASKVFMEHVSDLSWFELRWDRIDPDEWNLCSDRATMALHNHLPEEAMEAMAPLFRVAAKERRTAPVHTLPISA